MTDKYTFFIATSAGGGAIAEHFRALAHELQNRGHKVILLVHGKARNTGNQAGDLDVRYWPSPRPTKIKDARFLCSLIRTYKPQCLIANFGASNIMMLVGYTMRVPFRVDWYRTTLAFILETTKTPRLKLRYQIARKKIIYKMATHLIANSYASAEDVCANFAVNPSKVTVFYNTLTDTNHIPKPSDDLIDVNNIVCAGRLEIGKGQETLIRAVSMLKDEFPYLRLTLIGDGSDRERLEKLVRDLGIESMCCFMGLVKRDSVLELMSKAYFTVVPSHSEAFGLVVTESMSVRTPVIASAVGGIKEIIRDGIDGYLVPPKDHEILSDRMRTLLCDRKLRDQMGASARQRFRDEFSQELNLKKQAEWFENLVRR